ncbi:MAG TPA: LPS assembly protein LptD [Gemmatales bacterium]|nr:LPS assembly protein LptD [Gemmatales bacterium]
MPWIWARTPNALILLFFVSLVVATGSAQDTPASDDKPITVYADMVQGWDEGEYHGLHARGNVSIERGLTRIKLKEAYVWVSRTKENEPVRAIVYGEGVVTLEENSKPKRTLERISVHWKASGELRIIAPDKKSGQPEATDPLYLRARQVLLMPPALETISTNTTAITTPPSLLEQLPLPDLAGNKPSKPTTQVVKQRDFTQNPVSPSPDVSNILNRSSSLGLSSRTSSPYQYRVLPGKPGETMVMIWGGITLYAGDENSIIDISADRVVLWAKGISSAPGQGMPNFANFRKEQIEVYLEGHVEIRYRRFIGPSAGVDQLVLADRGYYDLGRNTALLSKCELIYRLPGMTLPVQVQAAEVRQLDLNNFEANDAAFFASRLPSDPDLKVMAGTFRVELRDAPRSGLFGGNAFDPIKGETLRDAQLIGSADNVQFRFMDVPVGALRHVEGDLRDPLGPFEGVRVGTDQIFGNGLALQFDGLELFGIDKPPNTRWNLDPLYYSYRGFGLISEFQTTGVGLFGFPGRYDTFIRGQIQQDYSPVDTLSVNRIEAVPSELRGLLTLRHRQELDEHWTLQAEVGYQSDRNFYEQWWKRQYDEDLLQATYLQLRYQNEQFAMSGLIQPNIRPWVNESAALPRLDGWLVGQDLFNTLTYFGHASAGFYRFNSTTDLTPAYLATPFPDQFDRYHLLPPSSDMPHAFQPNFNLARFDFMNELDLPLHLGVLNLTPYALADAAYYSTMMDDSDGGRFWYGYGVRAQLGFSRLYDNVQSDFFNVRSVNHKISWEADYRWAQSNVDFRRLPLIDRLDDDPTDQARRDLRMYRLQNMINLNLATSPLYDPQLMALRRGYLGSPDNLDDMEYLRFGVRNRWQTKRGVEEAERIVDWISFDIFATWFPNEGRDNYNHPFGLIDYDFRWQVGDRTSIVAQGTVDPFDGGGRSLNAGVLVERTERLRFYFGYYNLYPVGTNAFVHSVSYVINPKYSVTWASSYDFGGSRNLGQSFLITRTGSDLQVSLGLGWDPLRNNFNASFEIYPTAMGQTRHMRAMAPGLTQLEPSMVPY